MGDKWDLIPYLQEGGQASDFLLIYFWLKPSCNYDYSIYHYLKIVAIERSVRMDTPRLRSGTCSALTVTREPVAGNVGRFDTQRPDTRRIKRIYIAIWLTKVKLFLLNLTAFHFHWSQKSPVQRVMDTWFHKSRNQCITPLSHRDILPFSKSRRVKIHPSPQT